jgi:hypothetical protein
MEAKTVDRLVAAFLVVLGIWVVWNAAAYGYMRETTPGPGFFPFWVGLGLTALSAVNLARSFRGTEVLKAEFDRAGLLKTLGIIAAVAAFIALAPVLGLLFGGSLLIVATAFIIRPRWNASFAATIVSVAVAFAILGHFLFGVYLRVPLVRGVLGF